MELIGTSGKGPRTSGSDIAASSVQEGTNPLSILGQPINLNQRDFASFFMKSADVPAQPSKDEAVGPKSVTAEDNVRTPNGPKSDTASPITDAKELPLAQISGQDERSVALQDQAENSIQPVKGEAAARQNHTGKDRLTLVQTASFPDNGNKPTLSQQSIDTQRHDVKNTGHLRSSTAPTSNEYALQAIISEGNRNQSRAAAGQVSDVTQPLGAALSVPATDRPLNAKKDHQSATASAVQNGVIRSAAVTQAPIATTRVNAAFTPLGNTDASTPAKISQAANHGRVSDDGQESEMRQSGTVPGFRKHEALSLIAQAAGGDSGSGKKATAETVDAPLVSRNSAAAPSPLDLDDLGAVETHAKKREPVHPQPPESVTAKVSGPRGGFSQDLSIPARAHPPQAELLTKPPADVPPTGIPQTQISNGVSPKNTEISKQGSLAASGETAHGQSVGQIVDTATAQKVGFQKQPVADYTLIVRSNGAATQRPLFAPEQTKVQFATERSDTRISYRDAPALPTAQTSALTPNSSTPPALTLTQNSIGSPSADLQTKIDGAHSLLVSSDILDISMSEAPRSTTQSGVVPLKPELATHVARQLVEVMAHAGSRPTEIALSPQELGRVRMSVITEDGAITVSIIAERPETLELMRRHIDQLGQTFKTMGYESINFAFGQGEDSSERGRENTDDRHSGNSETSLHGHAAALSDQPTVINLDTASKSGVDIRL